jgi:hypothetical protein
MVVGDEVQRINVGLPQNADGQATMLVAFEDLP